MTMPKSEIQKTHLSRKLQLPRIARSILPISESAFAAHASPSDDTDSGSHSIGIGAEKCDV